VYIKRKHICVLVICDRRMLRYTAIIIWRDDVRTEKRLGYAEMWRRVEEEEEDRVLRRRELWFGRAARAMVWSC
jgi:hypothetical protein